MSMLLDDHNITMDGDHYLSKQHNNIVSLHIGQQIVQLCNTEEIHECNQTTFMNTRNTIPAVHWVKDTLHLVAKNYNIDNIDIMYGSCVSVSSVRIETIATDMAPVYTQKGDFTARGCDNADWNALII